MNLTPQQSRQHGVVLVVSLLLLLILTVIGLAATQSSWLQLKMAGNSADRGLAFQAAEAALVNCQKILDQSVLPPFTSNGNNGYYLITGNETKPRWEATTWGNSDSHQYDGPVIEKVAAQPRCIIEQLPAGTSAGGGLSSDNPHFKLNYRVTARALGASPKTVVMLQATYAK